MKEIISIHIGQAGNQIGMSIWELFCAEHGIQRDGHYENENINAKNDDRSFETFFQASHRSQLVPRGLFIDIEPTVINQLQTGPYRDLYHPRQLIHGTDDSSGNFSRAFHTVGRTLYTIIENRFRLQFEGCNNLQSIMIYKSLGGGCGSGMTAMIFEMLEQYSKIVRFEIPIHPSPHFDCNIVAPYNSILGEHFCLDECDLALIMDNEALFDACSNVMSIMQPNMTTINRIMAQVCSNITSATRFHNNLDNDLSGALTNLVPYPRIHFPLVSFAPFMNSQRLDRERNDIESLTRAVFDASNQLVKCDASTGKYMACSLIYRGLVSPSAVYDTLTNIKLSRRHRFVDWCPTGFKVGIVDQPPLILQDSKLGETDKNVVMMTNSSSISCVWQRLAHKFHRLYSKRSFVHWFVGEGLEESEFCEALYNLATLAKDYEEVSIDTKMLQNDLFQQRNDGEGGEGGESKPGEGGEAPVGSEAGEDDDDKDDEDDDDEDLFEDLSNASNVNGRQSTEIETILQPVTLSNSLKSIGVSCVLTDSSSEADFRSRLPSSLSVNDNSSPTVSPPTISPFRLQQLISCHQTLELRPNNICEDIAPPMILCNTNSNNYLHKAKPPLYFEGRHMPSSFQLRSRRSISNYDNDSSEDEESTILQNLVALTSYRTTN